MSGSTRRTPVRAAAIAVQWLSLTIALGSLVIRSDASFEDLISPHFGALPMFLGAIIAGILLGLTISSAKALGPLTILLCICAAGFIGVLNYAPVFDGVLVRTTGLDNYIAQRVLIVSLILILGAAPGAVAGNLLGALLKKRQEIMPDPDEISDSTEVPWWEQRHDRVSDRRHTSG